MEPCYRTSEHVKENLVSAERNLIWGIFSSDRPVKQTKEGSLALIILQFYVRVVNFFA